MRVIPSHYHRCLLCLCILLASCRDNPRETSAHESPEAPARTSFNNQPVPEGILLLRDSADLEELSGELAGNLYGRFFYNRAEFFVVENPENTVHDTKVKFISMCYLDGQLTQTRYELSEDIADKLIRAYGSFSIQGFDPDNLEVIRSGETLVRTPSGTSLSAQLNNYELKWSVGSRQIKYRVNLADGRVPFLYTERLLDYDSRFRQVERGI